MNSFSVIIVHEDNNPFVQVWKTLSGSFDRFMGMSAAIVTGAPAVKCFGEKLGFTAVDSVSVNLRDGQSSEVAAMELLKLLGFEGGKTLDKDHFDLVFLHLGAHIKENGQHDVECMNSLIGSILQAAQPRSEIGSRLHLSVVMSYGSVMEDDPNLSLMSLQDGNSSGYSSVLPRQSYTLKGVNLRNGIRYLNFGFPVNAEYSFQLLYGLLICLLFTGTITQC